MLLYQSMTPNFGVLGNVPNTDLYRSLGEETCTDPPPPSQLWCVRGFLEYIPAVDPQVDLYRSFCRALS